MTPCMIGVFASVSAFGITFYSLLGSRLALAYNALNGW